MEEKFFLKKVNTGFLANFAGKACGSVVSRV